jgi:hypothetical protein
MGTGIVYPGRHPLTLRADPLIESSIVAGFGCEAFRFMVDGTAKPGGGLCAVRWAANTEVSRTTWRMK